MSASEISHDLSKKVQTLRKFTLSGDCFAPLAKTIKQPVIASRRRGNPTEKVRNLYSVDLHPPGSRLPDETGEVARVSATKGGRAVEPAAVALPHFKENPSLNNEKNRRPILLDKFTVFPLKSVFT